jgi:23S rRNA (adenine1618-N6)-methyltransferase
MSALKGSFDRMFHPRNRHQGHYDFEALKGRNPELALYVARNIHGNLSIDFANPKAVKALNRALLEEYYGVRDWDFPEGFLCPPIPGRADYIHLIADLLADRNSAGIPCGAAVRGLDIGVGANGIFPIIGFHEYGWSFVGAEINPESIRSIRKILASNSGLQENLEIRQQLHEKNVFQGIIGEGDRFDFSMCNPPFHASLEEARAGARRKWKNLGKPAGKRHEKQLANFGGQESELWCKGGEIAFLQRMILESADFKEQCVWFTTLVSKSESLPVLAKVLKRIGVKDSRILEMSQGQKKSRVLAWTF